MSNNNEYNEFNNYTQPEPQEPQPQPQSQPQPQQMYYAAPAKTPEQTAQTLGSISIILGLFGCCMGPASVIGLTLAIIGVTKDKNSIVSIVGIVLCAMMALMWIYSIVMLTSNPEIMQSYWDMVAQLSGQ